MIQRVKGDFVIPEIKELWRKLLYRVVIRIIWPIIPISMEVLIRALIIKPITFPNQTVLVLAFIVPSSYLPDFRGEISINLISMGCLLATVPFFCSIVADHRTIYWMGFALLLFFMLLFMILDLMTTLRKHSNILDKGN